MRRRIIRTMTETHEVWVVRKPSVPALGWCPQCAGLVKMGAPDEAAALIGTSTRLIYSWLEMGMIHFRELPEGTVAICLSSLPVSRQNRSERYE